MHIYDCTLCLLPEGSSFEDVSELYKLLCQLPLIVECPPALKSKLKKHNLLNDNTRQLSCLPSLDIVSIPEFGECKKKCSKVLFPLNDLGIAGAIVLRELEAGGAARTAFGGLHNTAPTEEVLLALLVTGRLPATTDFSILPQIKALWQKLTANKIDAHKPIIGSEIFTVESGIHVDGILKNPELYEPFPPETIGMKRKIVLGSHSGHVSVREKLKEYGITCGEGMIDALLTYVQTEGRRLKRHLTDEEFLTALGGNYAKRSSIC